MSHVCSLPTNSVWINSEMSLTRSFQIVTKNMIREYFLTRSSITGEVRAPCYTVGDDVGFSNNRGSNLDVETDMFSNLCLVVAIAVSAPADSKEKTVDGKISASCKATVKACTDAQVACEQCFVSCKQMMKTYAKEDGSKEVGTKARPSATDMKEHGLAMECCLGCADACKLASSLIGRASPVAPHAGECCQKCCADCATACEKFPDNQAMVDCAIACRACEKACIAMSAKKLN
jgi:hypothetical protein